MKNTLFIFLALIMGSSANAQIKDFFKKVDKAVNEAIEEVESGELEEKANKAFDEILDEIEEGFDESSESNESRDDSDENANEDESNDGSSESNNSFKNLFQGDVLGLKGPPENVEPNPTSISFHMVSEVIESDKKNIREGTKHAVTYSFDTWKTGMAMQSFDPKRPDDDFRMKVLLDLKEKTRLMASSNDDKWSGTKTWMSDYRIDLGDQGIDDNSKVTPTGNTKMIEGYNCEEFKIEDDDMEGTMWATRDINVNMAKLMETLLGGFGVALNDNVNNAFYDDLFWLESDMIMDGGKYRIKGKITDIKKGSNIDKSSFSFDGIPIDADLTKM